MAAKKIEVNRYPELVYVVPKGFIEEIASAMGRNGDPQIAAMEYVNATYGLLGTVTTIREEG